MFSYLISQWTISPRIASQNMTQFGQYSIRPKLCRSLNSIMHFLKGYANHFDLVIVLFFPRSNCYTCTKPLQCTFPLFIIFIQTDTLYVHAAQIRTFLAGKMSLDYETDWWMHSVGLFQSIYNPKCEMDIHTTYVSRPRWEGQMINSGKKGHVPCMDW